jgi:DGQHR domain-containing protein
MKSYTIPAINIVQKQPPGHEIFMGIVKVKDLLEPNNPNRDIRFKVHKWEHDQKIEKGYQRAPEKGRIEKIKNYLQVEVKDPLFPTGILVSARKPLNFRKFEISSKKTKERKNDFGELEINQTLYIIDGQHRIEAFKDIMERESLASRYGYIELPIVILSNFNYKEEVEQFFVINSRQKAIKTDLAQRIFIEITKNDDQTNLISEKDKWQMPAVTIVDELNKDENSHWYGLIGLPDDDKDVRKERVITQNSFVKSLKPFFVGSTKKWNYSSETSEDGKKIVKECKKLINNYWDVIEKVWEDAFVNKKNYILFKTVGVFSLHLLLALYLSDHPKLSDEEAISNIKNLLIYAKNENKLRDEFWQVGNRTAKEKGLNAGAYSNSAGHKKIAVSILHKEDVRNF